MTILNAGTVVWQSLNNSWLTANPQATFVIPSVIGDTVRISLNTADYLSLAEVQVWSGAKTGVPEPGSLALMSLGLGALGFARQRRKQQA